MNKAPDKTDRWLDTLGYDGSVGVIYRSYDKPRADHPYAREIELMLSESGEIRASAVYEVDRVPAVCFIEAQSDAPLSPDFIAEVRRKIWNQNLVSIILVVDAERATAYPAPRDLMPAPTLKLNSSDSHGLFSAGEIARGAVQEQYPKWFDTDHRVDHVLLENLGEAVQQLNVVGRLTLEQAQLVIGKCIFVSYLEHRGITGDSYREKRRVDRLLALLEARNGQGLYRLFRQLKADFNGDLLEIEGGDNVDWRMLNTSALELLEQFLKQTRLRSGQKSFWPYDFKYIPVELVSGIYESFLGAAQRASGAVYTPRHLAVLAVDEALRGIEQPWQKIVADGACGSGILLTTAYRRMLGMAEQATGHRLDYQQRHDILLGQIRGGDISRAACKVTTFSLYLALLEGLAPNDITLLQDDQRVKLPELMNKVIYTDSLGDFFNPKNPVSKSSSIDIAISNPPWFQPAGDEENHAYEAWWKDRFGEVLPRRQIALAFARRATDALKDGGRLCVIMPASVLASSGIGPYLQDWFRELQPQRIFNLADMRFVLFPGAIHPTAMITGERRPKDQVGRIPGRETCEYLVPKADISLAFGRLTTHSADRKRLQVQALCEDPEVLRTYFWGTQFDEALVARLRLCGTIGDLTTGKNSRFVSCKGFRETDKSRTPVSTEPLRKYRFLPTGRGVENKYPKNHLFVSSKRLEEFPSNLMELPRLGSKNNRAFEGARVLFPDGAATDTLEVRACFADKPFCFNDTIGAIVDIESDGEIMQFLTAYLRSPLASYLLYYTAFSLTMERPHVKLAEIEGLPFTLPEHHSDPTAAKSLIQGIVSHLKPFRLIDKPEENPDWEPARELVNARVFDYFGLSSAERRVVIDTCKYLIPSRQPQTISAIRKPLLAPVRQPDFLTYADTLRRELASWRDRIRGKGHFGIDIFHMPMRLSGSMAVVKLSILDHSVKPSSSGLAEDMIRKMLNEIRGNDHYPIAGSEVLSVASDFLIRDDEHYYLVKPLIKRLWLSTAAVNDAFRIVQAVQTGASEF